MKICHATAKFRCQVLDTYNNTAHEGTLDTIHVLAQLYVCQVCGWWTIPALMLKEELDQETQFLFAGQVRGELIIFNTETDDLPIDELTRYLAANYNARHVINPFKIEEAVASIFKSCGYYVELTPRSRDNGVDMYIIQKNDITKKAVQVKRYKNKIGAELIRSFAGAMLYKGLTQGVFVTTGQFTSGARSTAEGYENNRGFRIDLLDAPRLFDMLKIGIKPAYNDDSEASDSFREIWGNPRVIAQTLLDTVETIEI
jgi:restriction system protein